MYNWMAQPAIAATTIIDGLGEAVVAYGYAMSGTSITACTAATIVTTTLYISATKAFSGARFGHVNAIVSPAVAMASALQSTVISPLIYTN
jgi:hypothetical protein